MEQLKNGFVKLKAEWEDNPLLVIGVISGAFMATAKLTDAISGVRSKNAYARRRK